MRLALVAVLATSCGGPKPPAPDPAPPAPAEVEPAIDAPAAVVVAPVPVEPSSVKPSSVKPSPPPTCSGEPNPKACPAAAPSINSPCTTNGVECSYSAKCCGVALYVCATRRFEARFVGCPR